MGLSPCLKFVIGRALTILSWDNPVTAFFRKSKKLRHSLGRPSRSDFVQFEFENISDSDVNVSSYDFDCYADGYDMQMSYTEGESLDATLSPGKKTKGSVVFEVPTDAAEILLQYETNYWTEDKIDFYISKPQ